MKLQYWLRAFNYLHTESVFIKSLFIKIMFVLCLQINIKYQINIF